MNSGARLTSDGHLHKLAAFFAVDLPVAEPIAVHASPRTEQPIAQFERRHFQADEQHRLVWPALVDRDVLDDVERQRRFAHAGPGGQNHEFRIVQAAGEIVVVDVAGFDAAVRMLMLHAAIDPRERFVRARRGSR